MNGVHRQARNVLSWRQAAMRAGQLLTALTATIGLVGCGASQRSGGYEASVEILVMPKDASPDGQRADITEVDPIATHVQLIQSPRIIASAVEQGKLKELPSMTELVAAGGSVDAHIRKNINVERVDDGPIMRIRYSGPNQEDCAKVLQAVVLAYESFLGDTFTGTSEQAIALIEKSRSEVAAELTTAEADYAEFRRRAELRPGAVSAAQEKLKAHEAALTEIQLERANSEARLEVLEKTLTETDPEPGTDLSTERDRLKIELRVLEKQQQKMIDMTSEAEAQVKRLAALEIEDEHKSQHVERLRELYDTVLARLREINLTKDYGGFVTETVAPIEVRQR